MVIPVIQIHKGLPQNLVLTLAQEYDLDFFVETGTYYGTTAIWAARHFKRVITIERSEEIFQHTKKIHSHIANIDFLSGDSRDVLSHVVPELESSAIFWLDAHWSAGNTYGQDDECPLIDELKTIFSAKIPHFIFIDDARLFLSPPPLPHDPTHWPSVAEIVNSMAKDYMLLTSEDVFIITPLFTQQLIVEYCQHINTVRWENTLKLMSELEGDPQVENGKRWLKSVLRFLSNTDM